jgi:hypothetical protein
MAGIQGDLYASGTGDCDLRCHHDPAGSSFHEVQIMADTKITPEFRIRFVMDPDAQFEESNGEARPMTAKEYRGNEYRGCPDHPRAGTRVIDIGGADRPQVQGCAVCGRTDYRNISYAEYLEYYGNPDRHVYLMSEVEKRCPCCTRWERIGGTGHIDFMDDSPELAVMDRGFTVDEIATIPGYLRELAREDLVDAGAELGE